MDEEMLPKFEYYLDESDPDVVVLRRQDGTFVAAFSAQGVTREAIVEAAKEDYQALLEARKRSEDQADECDWTPEGREEPVVQPTTSFITWGSARLPLSARNRGSGEPARLRAMQVVEHSDALVRRTVLGLSRLPAGHILEGAAREEIRGLKPHLEEALEALKEIESRRGLTDQELAQRRAFRMLLETGRILLEQTT
jgi:hypothetical protein